MVVESGKTKSPTKSGLVRSDRDNEKEFVITNVEFQTFWSKAFGVGEGGEVVLREGA